MSAISVQDRYSAAAHHREEALCCPITYDPIYLSAIPREVIDRDYGCGDPSQYVSLGETVLDLGSGSGKVCFVASQIVGPAGRIIGIDRNRDMLALARRSAPQVAAAIGYGNVEFRCGSIHDLALDGEALELWLTSHPVINRDDVLAMESEQARLRRDHPLIADESVDVAISNCVLNLVEESHRASLFSELYRVVKSGGRVAISDIVSDDDIPEHMRNDPDLWSGCISGAFREDRFLRAFAEAGFHGVQAVKRDERPWRVIEGIEFRSLTVVACKGKVGPCREGNQAIMYPGPWSSVTDDDGHVFVRGQRTAVCSKTYRILTSAPYRSQTIGIPPYRAIPEGDQLPYACQGHRERTTQETKNGPMPSTYSSVNGCCDVGTCGL